MNLETILKPIILLLNEGLTVMYNVTHDWALAIVLLTIGIRGCLFTLNLKNTRQQVIQGTMQPKLLETQKRYAKNQEKLLSETLNIYKEYGYKPAAVFGVALLQMPVFLGMYYLFITYGSAMSSMFIPWVVTLAEIDHKHLLPVLGAFLTLVTFMIPLTSLGIQKQSLTQRISLAGVFAVLILLFMWRAPIAVAIYWTTNSLVGLLERIFYRTSVGKALLYKGIKTVEM